MARLDALQPGLDVHMSLITHDAEDVKVFGEDVAHLRDGQKPPEVGVSGEPAGIGTAGTDTGFARSRLRLFVISSHCHCEGMLLQCCVVTPSWRCCHVADRHAETPIGWMGVSGLAEGCSAGPNGRGARFDYMPG